MATNIEGLSLKITTTAGQASTAISHLRDSLKVLSAQLESIDTDNLSAALTMLSHAFSEAGINASSSGKSVKKATEEISEGLGEVHDSVENARELGEGVADAAEQVDEASEEIQGAAHDSVESLRDLGEGGVKAAAQVEEAMEEVQSAGQGINAGAGISTGLTSFIQSSNTFKSLQTSLAPVISSITKGMEAAGVATEGFSTAISSITTVAAGVGIAIKAVTNAIKMFLKFVKAGYQIVRKAIQLVQSAKKFLEDKLGITELKSLINSIVSMLKRQIIRRAINNALSAIEDGFSSGIENLEKYDARFGAVMSSYRNALGLFKNSVATAFAPVIAYAIPYLVSFLNTLTWVCNQIARLTALLTGQHTYTIAKSYEEIADAATSAGSAAKEAEKTILGFDEINQLNGNNGSGSGSGSGSGDALSAYETVEIGDWPYSSWGEAFSAFLDWLNGDIIPSLDTTLDNVAVKLNDFASGLYDLLTYEGVQEKISQLGQGIGSALNKFFNEGLDWEIWGKAIGIAIQSALNLVSNIIETFDFVALGENLATFVGNAIREIKPEDLAKVLAVPITSAIQIVGGFFSNPEVVEIARFGAQVANSMVDAIREAWHNVKWGRVKDNVVNAINTFFKTLDVDDLLATVDEITWTIYEIVSSAIDALAKNPKFIKLVTGVMVRLGSLAARALMDAIFQWIPDALSSLIFGDSAWQVDDSEYTLYGLYDPALAEMDRAASEVDKTYIAMQESSYRTTQTMYRNTVKDFAAIAQETNKSFSQASAAVQTQTANMNSSLIGVSTTAGSMSNTVSTHMKTMSSNAVRAASDIQVGVSNSFKGLSSSATSGVNGLKSSISSGMESAKNTAVKAATDTQKSVTNAFNSMYGGAKGGMNNMITGAEKMANGIIDANNSIIKSFDSMSIGGKKVTSSSGYVNKVSIPRLATGGIISSPTQAIIGESGAEAVVPLERNTGWIDRLASAIAQNSSVAADQTIENYVVLDGRVIAKSVNRVNARDSRRYSPVG